jgi:hypothetical protein
MSPGSFDAAEKMGIKLLALSPKDYAQMTYDNKDRSDFWKDKVVYYHSNPPFDSLAYRENLEIVYHACQWDKNFLSKSMAQDLLEFLIKNESNEFCFLEDMRE